MTENADSGGHPRPVRVNFCGCCGEDIRQGERPPWCAKCRPHIVVYPRGGLPPWERTYFAQHGKDCPFQVTTLPHIGRSGPDDADIPG